MFPIDSYWIQSPGLGPALPVTAGDESCTQKMSRGGDGTLVLWGRREREWRGEADHMYNGLGGE